MRRLCDEGVRSYLGRSRLVGESPTALPEREVSRGRSSASTRPSRPDGKRQGPNESKSSEDKKMSKAMRQMPEPSGREGVAHSEAGCDPFSDEADGPLFEHPDKGHLTLTIKPWHFCLGAGQIPRDYRRAIASTTLFRRSCRSPHSARGSLALVSWQKSSDR